MDGDVAAIISGASSIVSVLFGALMFSMRQQREDWKGLFDAEKIDHKQDLKDAALEARENAKTYENLTGAVTSLSGNVTSLATNVNQLFDMVAAIPKRESDYPPKPVRRT